MTHINKTGKRDHREENSHNKGEFPIVDKRHDQGENQ